MPDDQYPLSDYPPPEQPPQNLPYGQSPTPYQNPPPSWPPPPDGYYAPVLLVPPVNATLILVFGILGIVTSLVCGIGGVFGIVAWVMGNSALQTLDRIGDPMSQRGTVNAGRICGIVGATLMALGILVYAGFIGYGIYTAAHDHSNGV